MPIGNGYQIRKILTLFMWFIDQDLYEFSPKVIRKKVHGLCWKCSDNFLKQFQTLPEKPTTTMIYGGCYIWRVSLYGQRFEKMSVEKFGDEVM